MTTVKRDVVLIIDDDNRNTFALSLTLKAKGYKFISCSSAEEGLDIIATQPDIGIVLIDMMMPEMDGYQAIKIMQSSDKYPDIPVIAVTAQAMSGDKERCLAAGATDYIAKPIDVDILMEILRKYI
ncbi:response regulator receiver domain-containing protein [Sphingobacterium alimentarium]|jgi:two-component system cell cycle response regulator DivK|uniref:Response regulator receiver domain-containing protein n=1 Tax=Sphingobacterium alimentarium TaxID=797292 RepID=A0A4R3VYM4_9SPHI|nr:response regulator [Sphingobacterium alimentarium]TCV11555.1 response regulator receiver domain-containing protein [Sphingobacterium alimentarium]